MRSIITVVILIVSLLIGCKAEKKEPKGPVADYFNGMLRSLDRAEDVQKKANLQALRSAIAKYRLENGKNPASLEDLRGELGEGFPFWDFQYNTETGDVTLRQN